MARKPGGSSWFLEIERILDESARASAVAKAEHDRNMAEHDQRMAEIDRKLGKLTNGWGELVEGLVIPGVAAELAARGWRVHDEMPRRTKHKDGETMELDEVALARDAAGGEVVLLVEVSSHLGAREVEACAAKLRRFREFFPEYRERPLHGIVAGVRVDPGAPESAMKLGLFVLLPSGSTVRLANPKDFAPRAW